MGNFSETKVHSVVAIRFDDVSETVFLNAKSILDKYGVRATFAQVSGLIDSAGYLTTSEISDLYSKGHEIVSHTANHTSVGILSTFTNESADEATVKTEVEDSKTAIEEIIGRGNCKGILYPYHNIDETGMRSLLASGYKYGGSGDSSSPASCQNFTAFNLASGLYTADKQGGRFRLPNTSPTRTSQATLKADMDRLITENWLTMLIFHDVQAVPSATGITPTNFEYVIQYLYNAGVEFVTLGGLYERGMGGKCQLLKKNYNLAPGGDLRRPTYNDATKPTSQYWYLTASSYVYSATGGPNSNWDGLECGYLKLIYAAFYYHIPIVKAGKYRVSYQAKKGDNTKNLEQTILAGSTVAPSKMTLLSTAVLNADLPTDWTTYTHDVIVPAGARNLYVRVRPAATEADKYHYLSDICIERIA